MLPHKYERPIPEPVEEVPRTIFLVFVGQVWGFGAYVFRIPNFASSTFYVQKQVPTINKGYGIVF